MMTQLCNLTAPTLLWDSAVLPLTDHFRRIKTGPTVTYDYYTGTVQRKLSIADKTDWIGRR